MFTRHRGDPRAPKLIKFAVKSVYGQRVVGFRRLVLLTVRPAEKGMQMVEPIVTS